MLASRVKSALKYSAHGKAIADTISKGEIGFHFNSTNPSISVVKSHYSGWKFNALGVSFGLVTLIGVSFLGGNDGSPLSSKILNDSTVISKSVITMKELKKHNTKDDCWVVIHGKVYDLTEFLSLHPGGANRILRYAGADATKGFASMHVPSIIARQLPPEAYIGDIEFIPVENKKSKKTAKKAVKETSEKKTKKPKTPVDSAQDRKQKLLDSKPPLSMMFNLTDFEVVAQKLLDPVSYNYFATGANDEFTLRENHYAFNRVFFRPRVGIDVSKTNTKTTIQGFPSEAPIFISSFAGSHLCDKDAELNLVRGAGKEKIPYIIPIHGSMPVEELAVATVSPDQTLFYQIDFYTREQIDKTPQVFKKLETQLPSIKGVFINLDLATAGSRERDLKIRAVNEEDDTIRELNALISNDTEYATLTWDDLKEFKKQTKLPIVVKGVQSSQDILTAAKLGLKGATISNHGGRQLDFSRPPLEVLAESKKLLKENGLDKDFEIYIDGGIKRGSDVLKAISLGATAVGLGRPFLFAMSGYGEEGVVRTIQILKTQMTRDLKLLGATSVKDLNEDFVDTTSLSIKGFRTLDGQYNSNYVKMPPPRFIGSPIKT